VSQCESQCESQWRSSNVEISIIRPIYVKVCVISIKIRMKKYWLVDLIANMSAFDDLIETCLEIHIDHMKRLNEGANSQNSRDVVLWSCQKT